MNSEQTEREMLRQFVRSLAEKKGGVQIDEERLIGELAEKIDDAILDALPDEILDKLLAMDENAAEGEVEAVMAGSGVDREKVLTKVLVDFRNDFLKEGN